MTVSKSMRLLLVGGLLCANLLMLVLAATSLIRSHRQYEQRASTLTQNIASALERTVTGNIEKLDLTLQAIIIDLTRHMADPSPDGAALAALMGNLKQSLPEVEGLYISDAQGKLIFRANGVAGVGAGVASRDFFQASRAEPAASLQISKPAFDPDGRRYLMHFSRRYDRPDGQFGGIVFATLPLDHFTRMLARYDLGPHGAASLRHSTDFSIIARHPQLPGQAGDQVGQTSVSREFRYWVQQRVPSATYHAVTASDGVDRIVTFRRLATVPLVASIGVASDDVFADWFKELYQVSAMAIAYLFLSWLLGYALLRMFDRARQRESLLRKSQSALNQAQAIARLGSFDWNLKTGTMQWSDELARLWGHNPAVARPGFRSLLRGIHPEDRADAKRALRKALQQREPYRCEYRVRWPDGSVHAMHAQGELSFDREGRPRRMIGVVQEITERKRAESRIRELVFFDQLTGLPNRTLLLDRLEHALAAGARNGAYGALLLIDLDDFKTINDTLGHRRGDMLLKQVADCLRRNLHEGDSVARLGGDEFVVLIEALGSSRDEAAQRATRIAGRILSVLDRDYWLEEVSQAARASIGVSIVHDHEATDEDILKQAELALYKSKTSGRNTVRFFDPDLERIVKERAHLEAGLRRALEQSRFELHYQAQVTNLARPSGVEALIRWRDPDRGLVPPADFITVAEDSGIILQLGKWALEAACAQLAAWAATPVMRELTLAVNVSARQFRHPEFVEDVLHALKHSGADANRLKLELTESLLIENVHEVIGKMAALRAHGVRFSLDDFGTGYSSLSYLKQLPLDQLKIDRSFVQNILSNADDAAIAQTIVALGRAPHPRILVLIENFRHRAHRDFRPIPLGICNCLPDQPDRDTVSCCVAAGTAGRRPPGISNLPQHPRRTGPIGATPGASAQTGDGW